MVIIKTQSTRQKKNLTTKLPNLNKNSTFTWVSSEQPGSGATLLGWHKSIYNCITGMEESPVKEIIPEGYSLLWLL